MRSSRLACRSRGSLLIMLGFLATTLCTASAASAAPDEAPSARFDLRHWKLTLPVDGSGGTSAVAAELQPADLSGYASAWFSLGKLGRTLEFWAPVNGATTSGSHYARSELREVIDPANDNDNWTLSSRAVLRAKCKVMQVPSATGKVVVGQIHGFQIKPLVKLVYAYKTGTATGQVYALVDPTPDATASTRIDLAADVPLGQPFEYKLEVRHFNGRPLLWMQVGDEPAAVYFVDQQWYDVGLYFKLGVYVQATGTSDVDGGRVAFYRLSATHPDNNLSVSTDALDDVLADSWYSRRLQHSGGVGPVIWSMLNGILPEGFTLSSDGVLSGMASRTLSGVTWYFTLLATDQQGDTDATNFALRFLKSP